VESCGGVVVESRGEVMWWSHVVVSMVESYMVESGGVMCWCRVVMVVTGGGDTCCC
jgi:hypothetical protein